MGAGPSLGVKAPEIRLRDPNSWRLIDPCDLCASALYLPGGRCSRNWMDSADEDDRPSHDHPFLEAVTTGDIAVMQKHLVAYPAAVAMLRDGRGNTAAHIAARYGRLEALELLVWHEPKLLYEQNEVRNTPAHTAAEAGQVVILQWLGEQVPCPAAVHCPMATASKTPTAPPLRPIPSCLYRSPASLLRTTCRSSSRTFPPRPRAPRRLARGGGGGGRSRGCWRAGARSARRRCTLRRRRASLRRCSCLPGPGRPASTRATGAAPRRRTTPPRTGGPTSWTSSRSGAAARRPGGCPAGGPAPARLES
jgi:hypothetical protein